MESRVRVQGGWSCSPNRCSAHSRVHGCTPIDFTHLRWLRTFLASLSRLFPEQEMPRLVLQKLKEARKEQQREHARAWYRKATPLSKCRLAVALAVWWESEKLACMGLRYLEVEYLRTAARLGLSLPAPPAGPEDGAVRPSVLPQKWRDSFLEKLRSMSEEDLRAFEEPVAADEKRRRKAKSFLMDVALSDFVEAKNRLGRAVSTRTIIERRGFLLDGDVAQIHGRLKRLPKAALRWAWRWQRRHGLTRGKFRFGNGLTPQQQMDKACSENVAQNDFWGIQCSFFSSEFGGLRGPNFGPASRAQFLLPPMENRLDFRPPDGFKNCTRNGAMGTRVLASICYVFSEPAPPPDRIL